MNSNKSILFVGLFLIVNQSMAMNINPSDPNKNPLLSLLCNGKIEELKQEVKNGADVNEYDLMLATINGYGVINEKTIIELVDLFIKKGADLKYKYTETDLSLLHVVSMKNISPLINSCIAAGIDVNIKDKKGLTPLHHAFSSYSLRQLMSLCSTGQLAQNNVLHIENSCLRTVEELILAGADVNAQRSDYGSTPLHKAASHSKEMVALLLFHNANYEIEDIYGFTPYSYAKTNETKKMLTNSESVKNTIKSQLYEKTFGDNNAFLVLKNREYGIRRLLPKTT